MEQGEHEVLSCPHCSLRQYMTVDGKCRRCRKPFVEAEPKGELVAKPEVAPEVKVSCADLEHAFAAVMKLCRHSIEYSQSQLARKVGCTRPFISRLESGNNLPALVTLFKIASALGTTPHMILVMVENLIEDDGQR
jgi:DNA-binding XRE family transcriptional regulator